MAISKEGTRGRQFDNRNKISILKKGTMKGRQFNDRDKMTNLKNKKQFRRQFNNNFKKTDLVKGEVSNSEDSKNFIKSEINGQFNTTDSNKQPNLMMNESDKKTNIQKRKTKKVRRFQKNMKKQTIHEDVANIFNIMDERKITFKAAFAAASQNKALSTQVYAAGSQVVNILPLCDSIIEKCGLQEYSSKDKNVMRAIISDFIRGRSDLLYTRKEGIYGLLNTKKDLLIKLKEENGEPEERVLPHTFVRVNTLLCSVEKYLESLNKSTDFKLIDTPSTYKGYLQAINKLELSTFMIDYHFKDLLVFSHKAKYHLWNSDFYKKNQIVFQDKSSLIGPNLLQVKPGHVVLDMCAAPGMKTVLMAAKLEGSGQIIAVENNKDRYHSMLKMVNSSGARQLVKCFLRDVTHFEYDDADKINLVLVDVPCSGSGMRNRLGETNSNEGRLRSLQWVQMKILTKALTAYPEAERILYCTCSIHCEENEAVVQQVMEDCGDNLQFKLLNCHKFIKGYSKGSPDYECGKFCLRVDPIKDLSNGFFVALFERSKNKCESPIETDENEKSTNNELKVKKSLKRKKRSKTDVKPTTTDPSPKNEPLIEIDETQESINDELKVKKSLKRKKRSKTDDKPTSTDASPQQKSKRKKKKLIKNNFTVSSED